MVEVLSWASIAAAFLAAALWWHASKVTARLENETPVAGEKHPNDNIWVDDEVGLKIVTQVGPIVVDVLETARLQSWWNSIAALAAATSAALQAAALLAAKVG